MVDAFAEGAKEAGHEVEILHVGKMKIAGCMRCETAMARAKASVSRKMIWRRSCLRIRKRI